VQLDDAVFGPQAFELELEAGHARVQAAASAADVRCEVATFSQLCCGALSASQARWYGLLEASDATVALLEQAFPAGPPFIHQFDWF
jgi:predicted acetyltransferase